jgi:hypothetical protein
MGAILCSRETGYSVPSSQHMSDKRRVDRRHNRSLPYTPSAGHPPPFWSFHVLSGPSLGNSSRGLWFEMLSFCSDPCGCRLLESNGHHLPFFLLLFLLLLFLLLLFLLLLFLLLLPLLLLFLLLQNRCNNY